MEVRREDAGRDHYIYLQIYYTNRIYNFLLMDIGLYNDGWDGERRQEGGRG